MARYTNFFMTGSSPEEINRALVTALEACDLNLVYQDPVCIVAKEKPGQVSFSQLATVEILISPPTIEAGGSKVDVVVKNEELPLRAKNHCHTVFTQVTEAITASQAPSGDDAVDDDDDAVSADEVPSNVESVVSQS